jgi:putative endopeptidase
MRLWLGLAAAVVAWECLAAPLGSGLDLAGFDRSVRPQDDLYRFGGGTWLKNAVIPPDKSNYGSFIILDDHAQADIRAIIEESAKSASVPGSDAQKVGDFYAAYLDVAKVNALGLKPLQAQLARIDQIKSRDDLVKYFGYAETIGLGQPIGLYIFVDAKNTAVNAAYVTQSGLGMPDRDYYVNADAKSEDYRKAYVEYLRKIATLGGLSHAESVAKSVMALETRFAKANWTQVENRDALKTYNKFDQQALAALTPEFPWPRFFEGAQLPPLDYLLVNQPSFFTALSHATVDVPLKDWRAYLKIRLLGYAAPFLTDDFVNADFDFYSKALHGQLQILPRWKRAVDAMDSSVGEILGRIYVAKHFPPQAKQRMDELVGNLLHAFDRGIDELDWMSAPTRAAAHGKLAKITVKIGYPVKWKNYDALVVKRDELLGNVLRSAQVEHRRNVDKLGKPVDRTEWQMTPQTVNAYYQSEMNEIVFPAAILHPPFFDVTADDAANYGAIGAVIGHEISHGFDDQGRRYDGDGNLHDWWAAEDEAKFKERANKLVKQYSAQSPMEGLKVNGELTLGENIGDLSGIAVAFRAYQDSLGGKPSPVLDGFTGEQRFFLGWSQVWRRKHRDDDIRWRLTVDPHSLSEYRVNVIASNFDPFYAAFDVKPGDKLYRPPEERVRIW